MGSIFRTADGAGISKIYLCGYTPVPKEVSNSVLFSHDRDEMEHYSEPSSNQISKVALGAEKTVLWEYHKQTWRLLKQLKEGKVHPVKSALKRSAKQFNRVKIIALELTPRSKNIFDYKLPPSNYKLALVVGNEVRGLNKSVLKYADDIVAIPMYGHKESLNVSVAAGIALYELIE